MTATNERYFCACASLCVLVCHPDSGMWITADFRLYPPVITANQELVSPTGDHRYRGGTERAHPRGFRVLLCCPIPGGSGSSFVVLSTYAEVRMYVCMCILGFVMLPHAAPYSWLQLPETECTKNKKQKNRKTRTHTKSLSILRIPTLR